MIWRASNIIRSRRTRGVLWLVAATPMLIFPALGGGSKAISGVGMMFLVFGLVSLRRPS